MCLFRLGDLCRIWNVDKKKMILSDAFGFLIRDANSNVRNLNIFLVHGFGMLLPAVRYRTGGDRLSNFSLFTIVLHFQLLHDSGLSFLYVPLYRYSVLTRTDLSDRKMFIKGNIMINVRKRTELMFSFRVLTHPPIRFWINFMNTFHGYNKSMILINNIRLRRCCIV